MDDCERVDVAIVGAGPAGLSAALILGRCRRRVLVVDANQPRNFASRALHGYLTRDGVHPMELRRLGRAELLAYPSVQVREETARWVDSGAGGRGFRLGVGAEQVVAARSLLLATGRIDVLPDRPGFRELYGRGVYHCPICDGFENRDRSLVAYGQGRSAYDLAEVLLTWSRDVWLCTDGPSGLDEPTLYQASKYGIRLVENRLARLVANESGELGHVDFADRPPLPCGALFFDADTPQKSSLPERLGCAFDDSGAVRCDGQAATGRPGLFVAGNVRCGVHLAITAAAEGAEAGIAINEWLLADDLSRAGR